MAPTFRFYTEEQSWWSFVDYAALKTITSWFRPARVLEFGPGNSTLALLEGGARQVDSCEDDQEWLDIYKQRFAERHHPVILHKYDWSAPVKVPTIGENNFDLAFIDGPRDTTRRPAAIDFCVRRSRVTIVPAEDPLDDSYLKPIVEEIARYHERELWWMLTGPRTYAMGIIC